MRRRPSASRSSSNWPRTLARCQLSPASISRRVGSPRTTSSSLSATSASTSWRPMLASPPVAVWRASSARRRSAACAARPCTRTGPRCRRSSTRASSSAQIPTCPSSTRPTRRRRSGPSLPRSPRRSMRRPRRRTRSRLPQQRRWRRSCVSTPRGRGAQQRSGRGRSSRTTRQRLQSRARRIKQHAESVVGSATVMTRRRTWENQRRLRDALCCFPMARADTKCRRSSCAAQPPTRHRLRRLGDRWCCWTPQRGTA